MRTFKKLSLAFVACLLLALPVISYAQDDMMDDAPAVCDSTLVVLLMVAEHDYDYLSHMEMLPNVDFGQYSQLIHDSVARMQSMAMDMTEEEMATMTAMQATVDEMMMMSTDDMLHQYDMSDMSMGSDMATEEMSDDGMMMISLQPGTVAGEPEACATLRAGVEKFLTAHVLADIESMSMDGGM